MIVVTGTPGTGKTSVARILSRRLSLPLIEANSLVRKEHLYHGIEGGSLLVDMPALKKELTRFTGIAEGHVLCEMRLPATAVVLRASPRAIRRRLLPRHYSKRKLNDNIEAEALDYCTVMARENYKKVIEVDTTGLTAERSAAKAYRHLHTGASDHVDWSNYFMR